MGALAAYVSGYAGADFQPMNITYGLINTVEAKSKSDRKRMVAERALAEVRRIVGNVARVWRGTIVLFR